MENKLTLEIPTSDGTRAVSARWPTDEEWIARQRRRKIIIRHLGRGATETDVSGGGDFDLTLLSTITGEELQISNEAATMFLNQLAMAEVSDVSRDADSDGFRVTLNICGGTRREFLLACPSAKQITDYKRSFVRVIDLPFGQQEIRTNLSAGRELFDALCSDGDVPIIYKIACVSAVASEIARIMEPVPEDF